ncbi:Ig-like domain-containing protein [Lactococcus nasutitermitis]|uniref:Ig-like domain-containing protein n=1 Tax=Lactococcus nasutitermitis TaxID=1652957 RepID=A0ABV9JEZ2_9LACT|nr:Ig-like domain-containing protein [Lactococcus nasutitermitis]
MKRRTLLSIAMGISLLGGMLYTQSTPTASATSVTVGNTQRQKVNASNFSWVGPIGEFAPTFNVNATPTSLAVGASGNLDVYVQPIKYMNFGPANYTYDFAGMIGYQSSDSTVLKVDSKGDFTALKAGTVTLTFTAMLSKSLLAQMQADCGEVRSWTDMAALPVNNQIQVKVVAGSEIVVYPALSSFSHVSAVQSKLW